MTPERRQEIERLHFLADIGSDEEAAYRDLLAEIDHMTALLRRWDEAWKTLPITLGGGDDVDNIVIALLDETHEALHP